MSLPAVKANTHHDSQISKGALGGIICPDLVSQTDSEKVTLGKNVWDSTKSIMDTETFPH